MLGAIKAELHKRAILYIAGAIFTIPALMWFLALEAGYTPVMAKDAEAQHAVITEKLEQVAGSYYEDKVKREQNRLFHLYGNIQNLKKKGVRVPPQLRQMCLEQQNKTNHYRRQKRMRPIRGYCR